MIKELTIFFFPGRITTTVVATRYFALARIPGGGVPSSVPNPPCITNQNNLCFWKRQFSSFQLDISVTNCGGFYVYFLQPTEFIKSAQSATNIPLRTVYCTTMENPTRGNGCCIFFSLLRVYNRKERFSSLQLHK